MSPFIEIATRGRVGSVWASNLDVVEAMVVDVFVGDS
jgi:hypothetical protein